MNKILLDTAGNLLDKDGEFGFIVLRNNEFVFKLTEEKYLTIEEMEQILAYMKAWRV